MFNSTFKKPETTSKARLARARFEFSNPNLYLFEIFAFDFFFGEEQL